MISCSSLSNNPVPEKSYIGKVKIYENNIHAGNFQVRITKDHKSNIIQLSKPLVGVVGTIIVSNDDDINIKVVNSNKLNIADIKNINSNEFNLVLKNCFDGEQNSYNKNERGYSLSCKKINQKINLELKYRDYTLVGIINNKIYEY